MRTLLNGLEEELQLMSSGQDQVEDNLYKEVLETLGTVQHSLMEWTLELDSVEQLYYAYMIYYFSRRLIEHQGFPEQHQSVLGMVALLMSVGVKVGLCKKIVDNDGLIIVIPAFESMALKGRVLLVHDRVMMEAFQRINSSAVLFQHLLESFGRQALLSEHVRRTEVGGLARGKDDVQDYRNRGLEKTGSEEAFRDENRVMDASGVDEEEERVKFLSHTQSHSSINEDRSLTGLRSILYNRDNDASSCNVKEEYEAAQLYTKRGLSLFSQEKSKLDTRDGTKSSYSAEVDQTSHVCVEGATGHELRSFDSEATRATSIEEEVTDFVKEKRSIEIKPLVEKNTCEMPVNSMTMVRSVINERHVQKLRQARNLLGNAYSERHKWFIPPPTQAVGTCLPPPMPQPPPQTSWCWKRRLESLTNVHAYISSAGQTALEELDTECQETICHAIACVFRADNAVSLIGTLFNNNVLSRKLLGVQDKHGNTPLHNAVMSGDAVIVREFVRLNLPAIFIMNYEHATPLDIAVSHRNNEVVECLLKICVASDPHSTRSIQLLQTSLLKAMKVGYTHYLKILLELHSQHSLGIDFECTDCNGYTAWHYLKQREPRMRAAAVELLKDSDLQLTLRCRLLRFLNADSCLGEDTDPATNRTIEPCDAPNPTKVSLDQSIQEEKSLTEETSASLLVRTSSICRWEDSPIQERNNEKLGGEIESGSSLTPTSVETDNALPAPDQVKKVEPVSEMGCALAEATDVKDENGEVETSLEQMFAKAGPFIAVAKSLLNCTSSENPNGEVGRKDCHRTMVVCGSMNRLREDNHSSWVECTVVSGNCLLLNIYIPGCKPISCRITGFGCMERHYLPQTVQLMGALKVVLCYLLLRFIPNNSSCKQSFASICYSASVETQARSYCCKSGSDSTTENTELRVPVLVKTDGQVLESASVNQSAADQIGPKPTNSVEPRLCDDAQNPLSAEQFNIMNAPISLPQPCTELGPKESKKGLCISLFSVTSSSVGLGTILPVQTHRKPLFPYDSTDFKATSETPSDIIWLQDDSPPDVAEVSSERHSEDEYLSLPETKNPVISENCEVKEFPVIGGPTVEHQLQHTSQLHPPTQSLVPQPSKNSEAAVATTTNRETSIENHQGNTESARRLENVRSSMPSRSSTSFADSQTTPEDHKERLRSAAELLHAQDYTRILPLAYEGKPPSIPPVHQIPYVFITALAYYKLSSHKKSVHFFTECLRLAGECGRDGDITICNIYIGDIEFAKRRYSEAAGRYQTALHHYSRESVAQEFRMVMPTRSAVWLKCGSAFKNASRVGDSVAAYEKAIELAASKKDQLSAHTSLGNLFQGIGENGRAVKEYEAAIKLAQELEDHVSLGWNHGNLGNALLGLHQRDKALHHLFKALDMAVDFETTPQAIGRAYNNLGTAFQSLNELAKAEEHYDLALAQAIYGNDIPGQARVYGNIGNLQMLNKQYGRVNDNYACTCYKWSKSHVGVIVFLRGPDFERCDEISRPHVVSPATQKYFLQGTRDLEYVIKHHEDNFSGIKGSSKGLSLSVSLFETNSRTFHRMQDCLVHIQKGDDQPIRFEDALLVAEQSSARTLGELMLNRRGPQLEHELMSPPSLFQIKSIVGRQKQATKEAVLMRIMNAKVIHLATHGSAVAGFLAFAGMTSSSSEAVKAERVLIYPEEIESLNISPALVVLSSCDSGRGVFKADGIQGVARAFILAGAQAVLTALWRVPDKSACIFMQFFYQYLVEGMRGTEALHKAILCLRCFSKYSQYIHWSGYQLTGREFQFSVSDILTKKSKVEPIAIINDLCAQISKIERESHMQKQLKLEGRCGVNSNSRRASLSSEMTETSSVYSSEYTLEEDSTRYQGSNNLSGNHLKINCRTENRIGKRRQSASSKLDVGLKKGFYQPSEAVETDIESSDQETLPLSSKDYKSPWSDSMQSDTVSDHPPLEFKSSDNTTDSESNQTPNFSNYTASETSSHTSTWRRKKKAANPRIDQRKLAENRRRRYQSVTSDSEPQPKHRKQDGEESSSMVSSNAECSQLEQSLDEMNSTKQWSGVECTDNFSSDVSSEPCTMDAPITESFRVDNKGANVMALQSLPLQNIHFLEYYHSISEPSVYVCVYGKYHLHIDSHVEPRVKKKSDTCSEIFTILQQELFKLRTSKFKKVVVVIDANSDCITQPFIIDPRLTENYYFQVIPCPPEVIRPEVPRIVLLSRCFGQNACIVGNPTIPSHLINSNRHTFPCLPAATEEALFLSKLFKSEPIIENSATKEAVIERLRGARFVHIATHCVEGEGLVFSDQILTVEDVEELDFQNEPPALVVLNCCETAEAMCRPNGMKGLALAFLQAGVSAVVSIHGKINDDLACQFSRCFYQNLIEKEIVGTLSLHKAMLTTYNSENSSHRYLYYGKDVQFISFDHSWPFYCQ